MNELALQYQCNTGVPHEKIEKQLKTLESFKQSDGLGEISDYVDWLQDQVVDLRYRLYDKD